MTWRADKLFKVWLRDGSEHWLLVHIEIQGDYEKDFPERMFDYNTAVRQLYNREVVSLAVLCDARPDWRPTTFAYGHWGCRTELTFRSVKLLDFSANVAELESSRNPFATVVLAHLKALETSGDPVSRQQWKLRLAKGLYRHNWSKNDVRQLFRLIDWIMTLPDEIEQAFRAEIYEFEKEKRVQYITTVERHGFKKGREEGLKKGREQGLERGLQRGRRQGRKQGQREGLLEGIEIVLETKFGPAGRKMLRNVRALSEVTELRKFARFLKNADTLDEVREHLQS